MTCSDVAPDEIVLGHHRIAVAAHGGARCRRVITLAGLPRQPPQPDARPCSFAPLERKGKTADVWSSYQHLAKGRRALLADDVRRQHGYADRGRTCGPDQCGGRWHRPRRRGICDRLEGRLPIPVGGALVIALVCDTSGAAELAAADRPLLARPASRSRSSEEVPSAKCEAANGRKVEVGHECQRPATTRTRTATVKPGAPALEPSSIALHHGRLQRALNSSRRIPSSSKRPYARWRGPRGFSPVVHCVRPGVWKRDRQADGVGAGRACAARPVAGHFRPGVLIPDRDGKAFLPRSCTGWTRGRGSRRARPVLQQMPRAELESIEQFFVEGDDPAAADVTTGPRAVRAACDGAGSSSRAFYGPRPPGADAGVPYFFAAVERRGACKRLEPLLAPDGPARPGRSRRLDASRPRGSSSRLDTHVIRLGHSALPDARYRGPRLA